MTDIVHAALNAQETHFVPVKSSEIRPQRASVIVADS